MSSRLDQLLDLQWQVITGEHPNTKLYALIFGRDPPAYGDAVENYTSSVDAALGLMYHALPNDGRAPRVHLARAIVIATLGALIKLEERKSI